MKKKLLCILFFVNSAYGLFDKEIFVRIRQLRKEVGGNKTLLLLKKHLFLDKPIFKGEEEYKKLLFSYGLISKEGDILDLSEEVKCFFKRIFIFDQKKVEFKDLGVDLILVNKLKSIKFDKRGSNVLIALKQDLDRGEKFFIGEGVGLLKYYQIISEICHYIYNSKKLKIALDNTFDINGEMVKLKRTFI